MGVQPVAPILQRFVTIKPYRSKRSPAFKQVDERRNLPDMPVSVSRILAAIFFDGIEILGVKSLLNLFASNRRAAIPERLPITGSGFTAVIKLPQTSDLSTCCQ